MTYINPFELLNFSSENLADADSVWIKRAKKKLFAEIELSESDSIVYNNMPITKSNCNRAIDDLDDAEKKEFHFFIFQNKPLNDFLTKGWLDFFTSYKIESIYKLPAFLDFISPFFSEQYDKVLEENYKKGSLENVRVILTVKPITTEAYSELCYKSTYVYLLDLDKQFELILRDIRENKSTYAANNFEELLVTIKRKTKITLLNVLPSFFQGIRNQIAEKIRSISVAIYNEYNLVELSLKINEFAGSILTIDSVAQDILKDHHFLKKHYETYVTEKQNEELVKKYNVIFTIYRDYINDIEKLTSRIEKGISSHLTLEFSSLPPWITKNLDISNLNALPDIFDNIRQQIALQLRQLSVEIWNKYNYIEPSIQLVALAATIVVDNDTKMLINKDLITLHDIKSRNINGDIEANTKTEIQGIINAIERINEQIRKHGMIHIQAPKVKTFLNEIFTDKIINLLSGSNEITLKRLLFDELEKTLIKLDVFYSNDLFKKIKPIGQNDGELAVRIEKNISGMEFKAKNVLNNVGTGLGKANNKMVTTLPPQISFFVYIIIFGIVISVLAAIFGSK